MHIKQIIIRGFKTYRDQVIVGPMSSKDNVVVGQNGHGKSNFFSAIMFVLSDKFSNIRQEEKQRLIHEGAAEPVDSACVEIILDNSDGRLPIDKTTVSIKRVLDDKKDEFFIDGKHVTKGDINNLLESAGFSKSNPYYVVQQGRVASLAGMNEAQCLDLLKEVAGTTVYDERKAESERLMEETKRKREKIGELMERVNEKIKDLQGESAELQDYTKIEKERRAMEYILYKNHVVNSQEHIDAFEANQADVLDRINSLKLTSNSFQEEIDTHEANLQNRATTAQKMDLSLHNLGQELSSYYGDKARIESLLASYKEKRKRNFADHGVLNEEIKAIRVEILSSENTVKLLKPEYEALVQEDNKFQGTINAKKRRKNELFTKQGSANRFKDIKDRNLFLNSELKKLEELKAETVSQSRDIIKEITYTKERFSEVNSKLPSLTSKIYEEKTSNDSLSEKTLQLKHERAENASSLASLRHEEETIASQLESLESLQSNNQQRLQILLPGSLFSTLERLKRECMDMRGFYGLFIDLITIAPKFQTCADIIGKIKVFSIIVDTFETAKKVLDLNARIGGEGINVYPLDWIKDMNIKERTYPVGSDSIALIKQIKVKEGLDFDLAPLVNYVFGKCLLVRNQDIANRYAKEFKLHCVTPDGQMVYSGAYMMRAGFHDLKKERIRIYSDYSSHKSDINTLKEKLANIHRQKDLYLAQDSKYIRGIQEITSQKEKSSARLQELKNQETSLKTSKIEIGKRLSDLEKAQEEYQASIAGIEENIGITRAELTRKEIGELSRAETRELETLIKEVEELEQQHKTVSARKLELESRIQELQQNYQVFLPERERTLEENIGDCTMALESRDQTEIEEDFKHINKTIENAEINIQKVNQDLLMLTQQRRESEDKIKNLKENQLRLGHEVNELQTENEKLSLRLMNLMENKENYIKKMGALGSLPSEEHEKFKSETPEVLMRLLEENSFQIKKYQHVNKRALEQHIKYTEKLEGLTERISDLDKSEASINDLLQHLESVKDEAVFRTFRNVAQFFSEVFHEIVPQGKGRLKMVKGEGQGVDKYVGVRISVSFSKTDEAVYKMQQLSGGQKTAVAIALIIAIQRADPAPFYLFDELDAALDSQLRNSLAGVILRSAEKAQFIMTTFKPELCKNATKLFEVKFKNKASTIRQVDRARALEVIQQVEPSN